ncbi:mechanosensitive channel MscK [Rubritalea halochordaticola]|uniref:Mechanosensitive channel MscK n=1 Tax=Rubritalea halochordaticola TaxID=714537 RepID=A0ABP9UXS7_9BACT
MRFTLAPTSLLLTLSLFLATPLHAQKSLSELTSQITQLEKSPAENKVVLDLLKNARLEAEGHESNLNTIQEYKTRITKAPEELSKLRSNPPKPNFPANPPEDIERGKLETKLDEIHSELENQRQKQKDLQNEQSYRATQANRIPNEISKTRNELNDLKLRSDIGSNGSPQERAEQEYQLQRKQQLESHLNLLKTTQDLYLAEADLLRTKLQVAANNIKALTEIQANWQKAQQQLSIKESEEALKKARILAATLSNFPELAEIAQDNAKMAEMRSGSNGLSAKIASINNYRNNLEEQIDRITKQRATAKNRIQLLEDAKLEIDSETGRLLRIQRSNIPDADRLRDDLKNQLSESAIAQLELLKLENRSATELIDLDSQIEALHDQYKDNGVDKETIKELMAQKRELMGRLVLDYRSYYQDLTKTIGTTKEAINVCSSYALFLDKKLLWIPSAEKINGSDFTDEINAIVHAFSPTEGGEWLLDMWTDLKDRWYLWAPVLLLVLILILKKAKIIKNLTDEGKRATKRNCSSFMPTVKALLNVLALTIPIPLLSTFLAWRTEVTSPYFNALLALAAFSLAVGVLRRLSRPYSILEAHIHLGKERTSTIYKHLRWYLPAGIPLVFVTYLLLNLNQTNDSGRIMFIITVAVSSVALFLITKPSNKVLYSGNHPSKLAKIACVLSVAIPAALIIGSYLGYLSSVLTIHNQLLSSLVIILSTLLVVALLLRWGLVSRRNLAIRQALKRREIALAERKKKEQEDGEPSESSSDIPTLEEVKAKAVDVAEVEEKTTRLIKIGAACALAFSLWAVWSTSLPALSFLDDVTLWGDHPTSKTEGTAVNTPTDMLKNLTPGSSDSSSDSSADSSASNNESSTPLPDILDTEKSRVSLQDLLIFFIALFLTFTAARNIPSLLELTLLSKLNLKPGGSFAVTTAITYTIVVVGIIIAFARIGITWSKVQWIAAAVTLGIGFGLQEVFANFVAGLILLFERPIRLGDYITVGDVSGRVTQIRIRATTIQQLNNRELVVPNKEFITGQVVNWTLKDALLRAEVTVGIAYGSDTELARKELLKVAEENSRVVKSQKPDVIFEDFADSTLNFTLRCHVNGIEDFIPVQSELRFAIDKAFREHDIEIAFPQRDIHIRSVTNLSEALNQQDKE